MKYYRYVNADDSVSYVMVDDDQKPPPAARGKPKPVEVDRMPKAFEDYCPKKKCWTFDKAARADSQAGLMHIHIAHAIKSIEARLVKAGYQEQAIVLSREAEIRGISINEMADLVLQSESGFVDLECERIKSKLS